jgi:hypothetical protein
MPTTSDVSPGAFCTMSERYLPMPSWVMPRLTFTPSEGTSLNFTVLFAPEKIASERSSPTFFLSTSKAATNSMSLM